MSYVDVFTGGPVTPAHTAYRALSLSVSSALEWPDLAGNESGVVAQIMDVTPTVAGLTLTFPDATAVSPGTNLLLRNLGAVGFTAAKNGGATLVAIAPGEVKFLYLTDNTTAAGIWQVVSFGVGVGAADAATLAGYGLKAIGAKLNQSMPVEEYNGSTSVTANDRSKLFVFVSGSATLDLPLLATAGNDWFIGVRNSGTGTVTIQPQGIETVDGEANAPLSPGESCLIVAGVSEFYTVGQGRSNRFLFTKLIKDVAGGLDVTLTPAEAAHPIMDFTGLLTASIEVVVPSVVGIYYVANLTTGAFELTVNTSGGTGTLVVQGTRTILVCDGVDVYAAQQAAFSVPTLFADGTEVAPGIAFTLDTNTGIYRVGDDIVGLVAGGNEWLRIAVNLVRVLGNLQIDGTSVSVPNGVTFVDGAVSVPTPTAAGHAATKDYTEDTAIVFSLALGGGI